MFSFEPDGRIEAVSFSVSVTLHGKMSYVGYETLKFGAKGKIIYLFPSCFIGFL